MRTGRYRLESDEVIIKVFKQEYRVVTEANAFQIYPGQIEADREITFLVGVFVARWSLAEFALMLAFLVAIQSQRQETATAALAATSSAEAKIQLVLKTLEAAPAREHRREPIRNAVKKLLKLCEERNALMHHLWGRRSTGEIMTINYRQPDPTKSQTVRTAESLKALCNSLVDIAHGIAAATGSTWLSAEEAEHLKV